MRNRRSRTDPGTSPSPLRLALCERRSRCIGNRAQNLSITKTVNQVVVNYANRLHVGTNNRRAYEAESPAFEILAECIGLRRHRRNLSRSFPTVEPRPPAHKLPAV